MIVNLPIAMEIQKSLELGTKKVLATAVEVFNEDGTIKEAALPGLVGNAVEEFMERVSLVTASNNPEPKAQYAQCALRHVMVPVMATSADLMVPLIQSAVTQIAETYNAFMTGDKISEFFGFFIEVGKSMLKGALLKSSALREFAEGVAEVVGQVCNAITAGTLESAEALDEDKTIACKSGADKLTLGDLAQAFVPWVLRYLFKEMMVHFWTPLTSKVATMIDTVTGMIMQLVDGVAGLIPEVGGVIFDCVTVPIHTVLSQITPESGATAVKLAREFVESEITKLSKVIVKEIVDKFEEGVDLITDPFKNVIQEANQLLATVLDVTTPILSEVMGVVLPEIQEAMHLCEGTLNQIETLMEKAGTCKASAVE